MRSFAHLILICGLLYVASIQADAWTPEEIHHLQSLSLETLPTPDNLGNRFANHPVAIEVGKQLFFDPRLSHNGQVACASCHQPEHSFADSNIVTGKRHTPSLLSVAHNDWFFWDGRKDSLWSQALAPLEDPTEHGLTRVELVRFLLQNSEYRQYYELLLQDLPNQATINTLPQQASPSGNLTQLQAWKAMPQQQREQVDRVFASTGKFIAAYVATLQAPPNRLDVYLSTLNSKHTAKELLSPEEKAGAKLFMGKAQCILCHSGPLFTNQGFHNIGTGTLSKDSGRAAVLDKLRTDRFNCLGKYSDAKPEECTGLTYLTRSRHTVDAAFKVPGLRNVSLTAPYFHDGSKESLSDVVDHYVEASQQTDDNDLPVIRLTDEEKHNLVHFLKML